MPAGVRGVDHGVIGGNHPFAGADAGGDVGQRKQMHLLRREARALCDPVVDAMAFGVRQGRVGPDVRAAQLHVFDMQESAPRAFAERHLMFRGAPRDGERAPLRRIGGAVSGQIQMRLFRRFPGRGQVPACVVGIAVTGKFFARAQDIAGVVDDEIQRRMCGFAFGCGERFVEAAAEAGFFDALCREIASERRAADGNGLAGACRQMGGQRCFGICDGAAFADGAQQAGRLFECGALIADVGFVPAAGFTRGCKGKDAQQHKGYASE